MEELQALRAASIEEYRQTGRFVRVTSYQEFELIAIPQADGKLGIYASDELEPELIYDTVTCLEEVLYNLPGIKEGVEFKRYGRLPI